jgi:hypothetical protein
MISTYFTRDFPSAIEARWPCINLHWYHGKTSPSSPQKTIPLLRKAVSTRRKFVVCLKGTLYPSISLLKMRRGIIPTPQGWEGNYAYL